MKLNFITNKNLETPFQIYDESYNLCEKLNKLDGERVEGSIFSTNENLICQKGKISEFNTMNEKKVYQFFKKVGMNTHSTWVADNPENPINSILGIQYFYSKKDLSDFYEKIDTIKVNHQTYDIYQNPYALPIGFMFKKYDGSNKSLNSFDLQNQFIKYLSNEEVYKPFKIKKVDKNTFSINITNDDPIFLNYRNQYHINIDINGENVHHYDEKDLITSGNIYIKNQYENQTILLSFDMEEEVDEKDLFIYYFDQEKWKNVWNILSKESLQNIKIDKNILEGNISVNEYNTLFLSIPYHSNFTVYVDGKKTKYQCLWDTFMGIDLEKGEHEIKLVYFPKYIYYGIIISLGTAFYLIIKTFKKGKI